MNFILSSDNNYAQHLGVAIYSILDNNRDEEEVDIYVIDNDIMDDNHQKLRQLEQQFRNAHLHFIAFDKWRDRLQLNMAWNISISSYGRLFVGSMLPETVERVIYLDCDMIIRSSLAELWNTEMNGAVIAAVQDDVTDDIKTSVSLQPEDSYFNAGMLLIDLKKWRENHIEQKCLVFIKERKGRVIHHDQGVLNGIFRNEWYRLPLENNLMTIHYIFNRKQILKYFGEHSMFYTDMEINNATKNPVIIHYTPSFTTRPWIKGCKHPSKGIYWDTLEKTPWAGAKPQKDKTKWYIRLLNWRYRNFSF